MADDDPDTLTALLERIRRDDERARRIADIVRRALLQIVRIIEKEFDLASAN